mgnify:CR=1 FL=1
MRGLALEVVGGVDDEDAARRGVGREAGDALDAGERVFGVWCSTPMLTMTSNVSATVTPFPAASPSAFTTGGSTNVGAVLKSIRL